ncbi:D-2-hydroxyacid dehydrogenase [Marinobacteraceae bacterium S3BR75-40.1]
MADQNASPVVTVLTAPDEGKPPGLEPLEAQTEVRFAWDADTLRQTLPGTDIMMVTDFRTEALQEAWSSADRLRWIHATSAGVDALMIPEVVDSDILVTNAQGIFDRSIAEYVLGVILMFAKDFPHSIALQRDHNWKHRDTERAQGKRVLVVGAGSIGRQIAKLTGAIGMDVYGIARHARQDNPDFREVFANEDLNEQLGKADYVVVAAPLTPSTEGLFDNDTFAAMQPHARFINIGRGPIVKTEALLSALQNKVIAGACLDVFEEEPLPADHPLWDQPNMLITAHMAGDFIGWRAALTEQFLENYQRWQEEQPLINQVDKKLGYVPK